VSRYRIEPLQASHAVEGFDCGDEALNRFLIRFALANQRARASRTYVALAEDAVVGFHTLVVGEASPEQAPERIRKGLARHPIPLMVLARLAVAVDHQGRGLGAALLKDAICRTLAAAEIAGIRVLAVHAKNERAQSFYTHFGFRSSPTDPLHLFVLLKDLQTLLPITGV
jgi:GNAT superfamily N-acetyltransferase